MKNLICQLQNLKCGFVNERALFCPLPLTIQSKLRIMVTFIFLLHMQGFDTMNLSYVMSDQRNYLQFHCLKGALLCVLYFQ